MPATFLPAGHAGPSPGARKIRAPLAAAPTAELLRLPIKTYRANLNTRANTRVALRRPEEWPRRRERGEGKVEARPWLFFPRVGRRCGGGERKSILGKRRAPGFAL